MKTAISVPDELFDRAEALANSLGIPRSQLYARALADYIDAHSQTHVTDGLNRVYPAAESSLDSALAASQLSAIPDEDW
jgi:predicted transcriptional regulator